MFVGRFSFPSCEAFERAAARSQLSLGSFLASPERPRMDCNACEFCLDKKKNGGPGLKLGPGTNFVEFISKSAGAERLRKF